MHSSTRRSFLRTALSAGASFHILRAGKSTDVQIEHIAFSYQDYLYRTPIKFGGHEVDRATLLNVDCTIRTRDGKVSKGFGSMPMGNVWSFPSKTMAYNQTLDAMKALATRISSITNSCKDFGHPIDLNCTLEPEYLKAAAEVSRELKLDAPVPKL